MIARNPYSFHYNVHDQIATPEQTNSTNEVKKPRYYRPAISAAMSAVVPGLGQAYNKKYWKTPVVWAIMSVPVYFTVYAAVMEKKAIEHYWYLKEIDFNSQLQVLEENVLINPTNANQEALASFLISRPRPPSSVRPKPHLAQYPLQNYDTEQMIGEAQNFRTDFETALVFTILAYILNIMDAFADGYFYKYDISEKLAFRVEQTSFSSEYYAGNFQNVIIPGLKLSFKF